MSTIKDRNGKDLIQQKRSRNDSKNTQKSYTKRILMTWITILVSSVTQSQIFCSVKSGGP